MQETQKPKKLRVKSPEIGAFASSELVDYFNKGFVDAIEETASECASSNARNVFSMSGNQIYRFVVRGEKKNVNGYRGDFSFIARFDGEAFSVEQVSIMWNENHEDMFYMKRNGMLVDTESELHENLKKCVEKLLPKKKKRDFERMCLELSEKLKSVAVVN